MHCDPRPGARASARATYIVTRPAGFAGGASPHVSLDGSQSGTVPDGHSRTPVTGELTGISARNWSPLAQMSTGSRTSRTVPSPSLRRMVTGKGTDVIFRSGIRATLMPPLSRMVTAPTPMSSTSFE